MKYGQYKDEVDLSKKLLFEQQNRQGSLLHLCDYKFKNTNNARLTRDDFMTQNKKYEYPINYFQTETWTNSASNQKTENFTTKERKIFKASDITLAPDRQTRNRCLEKVFKEERNKNKKRK